MGIGDWGGGDPDKGGLKSAIGSGSQERSLGNRTKASRLGRKVVYGPRAIPILLDEAAMVLCSWGSVHSSPALLTVVAQAVDVPTEIGGIASGTVDPAALITHLVIQHVRLHLNLEGEENYIHIKIIIHFNKFIIVMD